MDAALTWALPVKVDKLGAHLQAYIETLDAIITLRLCNRHGTGPAVAVQKLPIEIVQVIERLLFRAACEAKRPEWQSELRCFEGRCSTLDHMTREEKVERWREIASWHPSRMFRDVHPDFEPDDQRLEYDFQYILRKDLLGDYDEDAIHEDWQQAWIDRVGNAASVDGFFDEHRDLLVKHFGVSVWTSHVQPNQRYWVKGNEGSQTTVTYLTLPQPRMRECRWADSENDCDCGNMPIVESGYGIPVELANTPTPASLKRFARALKILDLSVFVHATQRGQTLGCSHADEADTEHKSKTTNTWPKLMLLLRSVPAY